VPVAGGSVSLNSVSSPKPALSRTRSAVEVDRGRDEPGVHGEAVDARSREAVLELVREKDACLGDPQLGTLVSSLRVGPPEKYGGSTRDAGAHPYRCPPPASAQTVIPTARA
jgi:hypothetical protein